METKDWIPKEECIAAIEPYVKKFDDQSLTVEGDSLLFFKALIGALYLSRDEEEDEEKQEFWENVEDDITEFGTIGYPIEIRGTELKYLLRVDPENLALCEFTGEYEPGSEKMQGVKNEIWMDWVPQVQLKLINGDPNMTPAFFSGDVKVLGSTKLGAKPRDWIFDFFAFIDREPVV
jgi:hypothetical protein